MPFAVGDLRDLLRLLDDHPEWKREVRRAVLTDELLELPGIVRDLAEAQKRTDERVETLARRIDALAAQMEALTARLDALTARVDALAAQMEALTARVNALTVQMEALTARVDALAQGQGRLDETVGALVGAELERRFRERVASIVRRPLRRARLVPFEEVRDMLDEAEDEGRISEQDADDVLRADAFVRAHDPEGDVLLLVEVSHVVDVHDVERAVHRARLLGLLGHRVSAAVAGEHFTRGAESAASQGPVWSWSMRR